MYTPKHFDQKDIEALHAMIRGSGFGTLTTFNDEGIEASHLPMLLKHEVGTLGTLHGHMARGNGQWRRVSKTVPALAIFLGPNSYVTPSWYTTKQLTGKVVPTWNYVAVHAYGHLTFFDDPDELKTVISDLTEEHENTRPKPWEVSDAPAEFIDAIAKGIVGFKFSITRLEGAWKLSQNRGEDDFSGVLNGLRADGISDVADEMEKVKSK